MQPSTSNFSAVKSKFIASTQFEHTFRSHAQIKPDPVDARLVEPDTQTHSDMRFEQPLATRARSRNAKTTGRSEPVRRIARSVGRKHPAYTSCRLCGDSWILGQQLMRIRKQPIAFVWTPSKTLLALMAMHRKIHQTNRSRAPRSLAGENRCIH